MRVRRQKPTGQKKIASERIEILFREAANRKDKANRYVFIARKIAMKYGVKIPSTLKKKFCHHCYHYFTAKNSRVRTNPKTKAVEYYCKDCKKITRYGYGKSK